MKRLLLTPLYFIVVAGMFIFSSCQKGEAFKSDIVNGAKPTSSFTFANADTNALVVTFASNGSNVQSYYWQFGDGTTSTAASPVHTYATPGKYSVILKVNSTAGYSASSTQTVTAIPAATASFTIASQFELGRTFNNTSTSVASVVWDFGDGDTSHVLSPAHQFATAGTYNVKVTVTGLLGDVVSSTQAINVQNNNLIHGGFEANTAQYWQVWSSQNNNPPVYGYTGDSPAGGYGACLRFPSFSNSAGFNELIYQAVQVVAGKQYQFSAVVKLPGGGVNDYLQTYISTDPNTWNENTGATSNYFLCLNNYHAWGATSSSTTAVNGDLYTATLSNGMYGVGVATKGVYTAPITGTVYIGIQAGVYGGTSNGDFLVDNVGFVQIN